MTVRFICLEGPDGAAKSTAADALAAALRARGVDAVSWHHPPHPAGATGADRVAHYQRSRMWTRWLDLAEAPHAVYVLDRGPWSGVAYAQSLVDGGASPLLAGLAAARVEIELWWDDATVLVLDAPDAVLDARLLLRGEDPAASWPERRAWRALARSQGWPVVDTSGTPAETLAAMLARLPSEVTP